MEVLRLGWYPQVQLPSRKSSKESTTSWEVVPDHEELFGAAEYPIANSMYPPFSYTSVKIAIYQMQAARPEQSGNTLSPATALSWKVASCSVDTSETILKPEGLF